MKFVDSALLQEMDIGQSFCPLKPCLSTILLGIWRSDVRASW